MGFLNNYNPWMAGTVPGINGGWFGGAPMIEGMGELDSALAQNAAMGEPKKKKGGFGNFLRTFAGSLGDTLTGNPLYAQQMQQQAKQEQMEQWYERKRQDELADYEAKKGIDAQYSSPDLPGLADEYNWFSQQPKEIQQSVQDYMKVRYPQQFTPPAPVNIPYGASVQGGDSGGGLPRVQDEAGYNALPPGSTYIDPNGVVRKKGGPSQAGSGGFP